MQVVCDVEQVRHGEVQETHTDAIAVKPDGQVCRQDLRYRL